MKKIDLDGRSVCASKHRVDPLHCSDSHPSHGQRTCQIEDTLASFETLAANYDGGIDLVADRYGIP